MVAGVVLDERLDVCFCVGEFGCDFGKRGEACCCGGAGKGPGFVVDVGFDGLLDEGWVAENFSRGVFIFNALEFSAEIIWFG